MRNKKNANEQQSAHVEKTISSAGIGAKIRRLRLKRSMGLVELGKRTGLSSSFLSQLETGRVVPTLRNLSRIAMVFDLDLSHFFQSNSGGFFRTSPGSARARLKVKTNAGSIVSESMSALIPDRSLVPCIAEFPAGDSDVSFLPEVFDGEEFVYVMNGTLEFRSEKQEEHLASGDVLWVYGSTEREYRCKVGESAKAMIVTYHWTDEGRVASKKAALPVKTSKTSRATKKPR